MKDGWVLIFDGKTNDGWKNFNEDIISGWHVEEGEKCKAAYGLAKTGKICLQDHGSKIWFHNIKIKEL